MERTKLRLFAIIPLLLVLVSCGTSDEEGVIIQGLVTNNDTGTPLVDAIVQITSPAEIAGSFVRTDTTGRFTFDNINVSTVTDIEFTVSLTDFQQLVRTVTVTPGQNVTVNFQLIPEGSDDDDGGGGTGDDDVVEGPPEKPASIILLSVSNPEINIRGTGGIVNSILAFQVVDSAGRALDLSNPVDVSFNIIQGPGGGEAVTPDVVATNDEGKAITSLISGDIAGVVKLEAKVELDGGSIIRSTPILIAISGGFPDPDRFFVAAVDYNVEGFGLIPGSGSTDFRYQITASVGDEFGNPVKAGTAVDFRTRHGGIIQGSAVTDEEGLATVILRPDGSQPTSSPRGIGFIEVEAKTIDENDQPRIANLDMLFTTRRALIDIDPATVNIEANGSQTFTVTVTDLNGYPMAAGTTIVAQVPEGLEIPDAVIELADYFDPGPGRTEFTFVVSDIDDENSDEKATTFTIVVTTPSAAETILSITGTRAKSTYTFNE